MRFFVWTGILAGFCAAAMNPTEGVTLPSSANYGGGDVVGSQLIASTYNAGGDRASGLWRTAGIACM